MKASNGEVIQSFTLTCGAQQVNIITDTVFLDSIPTIIIGASSEFGLNVLKINCATRILLYSKAFGESLSGYTSSS
jgi:hypothetical protein